MNSSGFFRYLTFGLKREWIELFFHLKTEVLQSSNLGPIQIDALYFYLRDMELLKNTEETTLFFQKIFPLFTEEEINSTKLWSFLWVNLCFNAPLFSWYSNLECGEYTREGTISLLAECYGKRNRSVSNAYTALIGTLEKTPIGSELCLGDVRKYGGQRMIYKRGGYQFHPLVVLYLLYKYAERHGQYTLNLDALQSLPDSPQHILAISTAQLKQTIFALFEPEFLTVTFQDESAIFTLQPHKQSLDVFALVR